MTIECPDCGIEVDAHDVEVALALFGTFDGLCTGCREESMNATLRLGRKGEAQGGRWVSTRSDPIEPDEGGAAYWRSGVVHVDKVNDGRAYKASQRAAKAAALARIKGRAAQSYSPFVQE